MMAALRRSLKSTRHSAKRSARKTRKGRKGTKKPAPPKSRSKRSSRSKGRRRSNKMNPYMKKVQHARKTGASSFTHDGKTYKKMTMKTGMVAFKRA